MAVMASGVKRLLPGRYFCVRIIDAKSGGLTSLYAEGPLQRDAPEILTLRRRALEKVRLPREALPPGRIEITEGEEPLLFKGSSAAVSAPLVASGQLFGAIQLEYTPATAALLWTDEKLLSQLANQAAVGVRNAKLIDELTFVRKYLEELLESANALIVATDRERKVMVFNQAFSNLTGFQKKDVLGRDFLELIPEMERPRVLGVLAESLRGERVHIETAVRAPNGREVRVALSTSTALSPHGEVEGVLAIGQDLTAVRDLERRVVQAEKLSSLGKLAASVAHEINNPMTAVAAYVDSLLERSEAGLVPPPDETDKLRKVRDNAQRILRFTQDLVSYARPASDKPQELDIHPILELAVSFCSHELEVHAVTLQRRFHQPMPRLLGVPSHLVQVFVNLITNACHALDRGGTLALSTGLDQGRAFIRVTDSGPGIPAEQLNEIFEPFFTTKPAGKGSGLGLSIVRGIVEKHGGRVEVQSTPGNGTVFSVWLPLPGP